MHILLRYFGILVVIPTKEKFVLDFVTEKINDPVAASSCSAEAKAAAETWLTSDKGSDANPTSLNLKLTSCQSTASSPSQNPKWALKSLVIMQPTSQPMPMN